MPYDNVASSTTVVVAAVELVLLLVVSCPLLLLPSLLPSSSFLLLLSFVLSSPLASDSFATTLPTIRILIFLRSTAPLDI